MSDYGWGMFKKGLKRRKKEVRRMRVMTCLAVLFLAFTLLLQDNLGAVQMELNYKNYGRWFAFDDDEVFTRYPYLEKSGQVRVGSFVYALHPIGYSKSEGVVNDLTPTVDAKDEFGENIKEKPPIADANGEYLPPQQEITVESFGDRRTTNVRIGAFSEEFAAHNGIELYEGHMPQADNEIVMELNILHKLGVSYELGQEISFYVSETEPVFEHEEKSGNEEIERSEEDYYLKLHLVSFKLVGTVKRYTAIWNGGTLMPGAIVTEAALEMLPSYENSYQFYDLKNGIGEEKVWEFAGTCFEGFESWRSGLYERLGIKSDEKGPTEVWNSYAYTNPLWGSSGVYRYVSIILMVMSTCILAYLMSAYLSKRRTFFMRMREIGATAGEVWSMAGYECVVRSLPYAIVSLTAAYLTAFLSAVVLSKALNIKIAFRAAPKTLIIIISAVLLMLTAALAAALIIYSGRGIADKKRMISKRTASAIRMKAAKIQKRCRKYLSLKETLKRTRRIHWLKTAIYRLVCILFGAMILLSFMKVYAQTHYYSVLKYSEADITGSYSDVFKRKTYGAVDTELHWNVTGSKRIDYDNANLAYDNVELSFQNLLSESFMDEIAAIPGIKRIIRGAVDYDHTLSWTGKWEEDAFLEECIMRGLDHASEMLGYKLIYNGKRFENMRHYLDNSLYMLECHENAEAAWNSAKPYLFTGADKESFLRGEQIIVYVDENLYAFDHASSANPAIHITRTDFSIKSENLWKRSPSFAAGDKIQIDDFAQDGSGTEVTVAAVLPMTKYAPDEIWYRGYDPDDYMPIFISVGSMELAKRVQEADGNEFGSNCFGVKLDSIGESENTLKFVSELCVRNHVRFSDTVEFQIESRDLWIDMLMTYGFFTVILLVLYVFTVYNIAREEAFALAPKYASLYRAGMPISQMKRQKSIDSLIQSLWQLLSVPLYALIFFAPNLLKLAENASTWRITKWQYVMVLVKTWFTNVMTDQRAIACVMLVLMLILCVINSRITHSSEKQI